MRCILLYILLTFFITEMGCNRPGLRIIGGRDADEDKYPYIVRLEKQMIIIVGPNLLVTNTHVCTCAVLTPIWTLTAAHCIFLKGTFIFKNIVIEAVIRYGTLANSSVTKVIDTIKHPNFRIGIFNLFNDISLIKTKTIPLKQYARVSALDFVTLVGQEVTLVGYGITNVSWFIGDANSLGKPLQILDAVVVQCEKQILVMTPAMCVARRCGQSSSICPGDSGGPLLHPSGVVGINSMGSKNMREFCNLKTNFPVYTAGIITPISPYIDWISDTIKNDALLPSDNSKLEIGKKGML